MSGQTSLFSEQISLFELDEKEQRYLRTKARYEEWLKLPEVTHVLDGSELRENVHEQFAMTNVNIYGKALHECDAMPDTHRIWLNPNYRDYWVLNENGVIGGEKVEQCPYCFAELAQGRGDVNLYKQESKHWLFFLHYHTPMRELGYQPEEDRAAIKEVWG